MRPDGPHRVRWQRGEIIMNSISIYPGCEGWFYEVRIDSRVVVFGWCASRARAEWAAAVA